MCNIYQWEFSLMRQCQLSPHYLQPLDARKFHDQFDQGYNQATSLSQYYNQGSTRKETERVNILSTKNSIPLKDAR